MRYPPIGPVLLMAAIVGSFCVVAYLAAVTW
jgi:hypothetical protein